MSTPPRVKCPSCGKAIDWSPTSPWRPFCSERCKLIDLGAWLAEQHAIPGDAAAPDGELGDDADPRAPADPRAASRAPRDPQR